MKIYSSTGGLAETNAYLVVDEGTKKGAIIDAPEGTTGELIAIAKKLGVEVEYLLLTHGHWDHISDHKVVTEAYPGVKVWIHPLEEGRLERPGSLLFELPYAIEPRKADGFLEDGQKIHVGGVTLAVMHTPGHAAGHVCFYSGEEGVLFAGDLLMAGAVGRYDLEDGDVGVLKRSLHRVMQLPDGTEVLSGHGPASTIGRERAGNPFILQWGLG